QGDVVARMDASASVSGAELVELLERRNDRQAIAPLLDRALSFNLEIPGLPIARASQLAGRSAVAEGRLAGRVALSGTPARPQVNGQLTLRDLTAQQNKLGAADLYLEGNSGGALLHVGIDPPGGGRFLGHVKLDADLGGRTLLARGAAPALEGRISGDISSRQLDLAFLSGLIPRLRRAGGTLDGAVKMGGTLSKPVAEGDAHLRRGMFDVVGHGVYEDVGLDAKFSPKEALVDRITGTVGTGTFSAILVASRRAAAPAGTRTRRRRGGGGSAQQGHLPHECASRSRPSLREGGGLRVSRPEQDELRLRRPPPGGPDGGRHHPRAPGLVHCAGAPLHHRRREDHRDGRRPVGSGAGDQGAVRQPAGK